MDSAADRDTRRSRTISFRVSDEEFALLRERSEAMGARSLSDFARESLCSDRLPDGDDAGVHQLSGMIQELHAELQRVADMLTNASPEPAAPPAPSDDNS